jgi:hypothetical protein
MLRKTFVIFYEAAAENATKMGQAFDGFKQPNPN